MEPRVKAGGEVKPGDVLGEGKDGARIVSPVRGTVRNVGPAPGLRGERDALRVTIEPGGTEEGAEEGPFPPLAPEVAEVSLVRERIREAGIWTCAPRPRPLLDVLASAGGGTPEAVILSALDREPGLSVQARLLEDRAGDCAAALLLLQRLSGAKQAFLALPEEKAGGAGERLSLPSGAVLPVPSRYPEALPPLLALRAGPSGRVPVIALECGLAALDAVRDGRPQAAKLVTVLGAEGRPRGLVRVPLGAFLSHLLPALGTEPGEGDKVVAGGFFQGFSVYTLDTAVDTGVDAVGVIPAGTVEDWSTDPCINCGACIEACPVNLQVQLITRYAEFSFFDRAEELGLFRCMECGLCALACTARRPLMHFIRLAKEERLRARDEAASAAAGDGDAGGAGEAPGEAPAPTA